MYRPDGQFADSEQPGLLPPRLGAYHQIVSLRRKPVPPRAGPYHQGASPDTDRSVYKVKCDLLTDGPLAAQNHDQAEIDNEEEQPVPIPTPYGSDESVIANYAEPRQRSLLTLPPKWSQNSHSTRWEPIWLSRAALVAFSIAFLLMLLATALLYRFSELYNGIGVQREANHYAWKYGPTAVLVVVGALWRQVDFANKILAPWEELGMGSSSAEKTLLLDYISPLLPIGLWMAIKNGHWAVAMSTIGQLLILGTTVFSTGLLILEPTQLTSDDEHFQLSSKFQLDRSLDPRLAWAIGPGPAQTYYGVNFYGLRYPPGTAQDFVIPEFQVPSMAATNLNYSMTTDGLKVSYDCEVLPVTNGTTARMPWRSILAPFIVANVTTKECDIKGVTLAEGPDHGYYHDKNASQNYQAQFSVYPCNADFDFSKQWIPPGNLSLGLQVYNTSRDLRLFMSVVDLRISPYNVSSLGPQYMYLHNVTAALCRPSYELGRFDVGVPNEVSGSAQAVFSTPAAAQQAVEAFPHGSLAMAVRSTTSNWYLGNGEFDYVLSATVSTFFQLMSKRAGFESISNFMDPDRLIRTGSDVFRGIAAQVLRQLVVQPANRTTTGSITYVEQRLRVKALSTGFMCGFLGLLAILALAMIFARPAFAAPDGPGSACSMVALLASSPGLNEILSPMGHLCDGKLQERLSEYQFRTLHASDEGANVSIEVVQRNEARTTSNLTAQGQDQVPSWRPMASTTWFLVAAICLPLAIIASLEIAQHFSDLNDGFISISQSSALSFATYIPSAVALGVSSLYAALQMAAATFAPYASLKRGKATAERTVMLSLVGELLPRAIYLSLKTMNFAVTIALFAGFIGSFLSILISGLYSAISVPVVQAVTFHQSDTFNFDNVGISLTDNEATAIDNLVEYLGLNSAKWTTGNKFKRERTSVY
ncbi:hypothetical protein Trco_008410 [Trichoderma cornu-damae]|uniref:Uncharacterized protein n=1 Tax=Trichoderma cornu-damae TaxID=654480 RepID=A0A9P8QE08_9HYPO|nr:hypothetical protein Trco_008410 [Trichoderma cornu-damae]